MKDCTFKPNIDPRSERIAQQNRGMSSNKSYEVLFNKHNTKLEKVKKLMQEKEQQEVAECTFTPQIVAKKKYGKREPENAAMTDRNPIPPANEFKVSKSSSNM